MSKLLLLADLTGGGARNNTIFSKHSDLQFLNLLLTILKILSIEKYFLAVLKLYVILKCINKKDTFKVESVFLFLYLYIGLFSARAGYRAASARTAQSFFSFFHSDFDTSVYCNSFACCFRN